MYDCFYVFKLDCFWIFNFSDINPKGLWLKNTLQMKHCVFHVTQFFGKDSPPTGAGLPKKHLTNETHSVSCVSNFSAINP